MIGIDNFFDKLQVNRQGKVISFKEAVIEKIVQHVDKQDRFAYSVQTQLGDWLRSNNQLEYAILSIVVDKFPFSLNLYNDENKNLAYIEFMSYADIALRKYKNTQDKNIELKSVEHVDISEIIGLRDTINRLAFVVRKSDQQDERQGKTIEQVQHEYQAEGIDESSEIGQALYELVQIFQELEKQQ